MGRLTQEKHIEMLKKAAVKRGASLDLIMYELNDPKRMKPVEAKKDGHVIHANERLEFFSHFGFKRVEFDYIQPQLTEKSKLYEGLMLCVLPFRDFQNGIPVGYLKQLLRLYVWAGFAGIPGSDINGHRNPDTDSAYLKMRNQLESLGKSACLRLVSLSNTRKSLK